MGTGKYCNESNGWCGDSAAHKRASWSKKYDKSDYEKWIGAYDQAEYVSDYIGEGWETAADAESSVAGIADVCVDGKRRCGPKFGGAFCTTGKYCNESNGWCGDSAAHKRASWSKKYDKSDYEKCIGAYDQAEYVPDYIGEGWETDVSVGDNEVNVETSLN